MWTSWGFEYLSTETHELVPDYVKRYVDQMARTEANRARRQSIGALSFAASIVVILGGLGIWEGVTSKLDALDTELGRTLEEMESRAEARISELVGQTVLSGGFTEFRRCF